MIDVALICTVFGVFIIFSFIKGVEIGLKLKKEEPISIKNPIKVFKEHKVSKKQDEQVQKEIAENEINLYNIDVYDGTSVGQREF